MGGGIGYFQSRGQQSAENERLTKQLAHQRAMDDRAYLRQGIEDAVRQYETTLEAFFELRKTAEAAAWWHAQEELTRLWAANRRVYLWLPAESQIPEALRASADPLKDALDALQGAHPLSEERVARARAALDEAAKAHRICMNTVRDELGASLWDLAQPGGNGA